jgi:tetratricopeptide (TPR) repeat protein
LARKTDYLLIGILMLALAGCSTAPTQPGDTGSDEVDTRVREPARQDSDGVQVYPLRNPAVEELVGEADEAEAVGDLDQAAVLLERALRIQPRNPEILQLMAEIQLQKKDYEQALTFATRSYDIGPRVGEICSRNWRTISVAREYMGNPSGSAEAEEKAVSCMNIKPRGH